MTAPVATISLADGTKYALSIRELAALKILLESKEAQELREGLFKAYMETATCDRKEAEETVGPILLEVFIDRARVTARETLEVPAQ